MVIDLNPAINDDNDFGFIRGDEQPRRGERRREANPLGRSPLHYHCQLSQCHENDSASQPRYPIQFLCGLPMIFAIHPQQLHHIGLNSFVHQQYRQTNIVVDPRILSQNTPQIGDNRILVIG